MAEQIVAPYPPQWIEGPARMMEKTEKMLGMHERWQDRRPQVLGIVAATRGVIEGAQDVSGHQRMTWLHRLAAIEKQLLPCL